jgi:hypothetical protein
MATKQDVKKQLEAILDHQLDPGATIGLIEEIASSTRSESFTTWRRIEGTTPNRCYKTELLDVSGFAATGNDGTTTFRLTSFLCLSGISLSGPINVLATPFASTPCFLTMEHSLVHGNDVEIKLWSWDADGAPASGVAFNWRCRVGLPTPSVL